MASTRPSQLDILIRLSRRELWWLLGIMVLLGASYLADQFLTIQVPEMVTTAIGVVIFGFVTFLGSMLWYDR